MKIFIAAKLAISSEALESSKRAYFIECKIKKCRFIT